jgi:hypothetical protein
MADSRSDALSGFTLRSESSAVMDGDRQYPIAEMTVNEPQEGR